MTQNVANLCVKCETKFDQWAFYHKHVVANQCHRTIRPTNTSGRAKIEIVKEWEHYNQGALI